MYVQYVQKIKIRTHFSKLKIKSYKETINVRCNRILIYVLSGKPPHWRICNTVKKLYFA